MRDVLKPIFAAVLAVLVAGNTEGCTPVGTLQVTARDAYTIQLVNCSTQAQSVSLAVECRRAVNRAYGLCGPGSPVEPC